MLIRNILEESVQKFGEVKAVKWLNRKEVLEVSSRDLAARFPVRQIPIGERIKVVLWRVVLFELPRLWQCYFLYWQQF